MRSSQSHQQQDQLSSLEQVRSVSNVPHSTSKTRTTERWYTTDKTWLQNSLHSTLNSTYSTHHSPSSSKTHNSSESGASTRSACTWPGKDSNRNDTNTTTRTSRSSSRSSNSARSMISQSSSMHIKISTADSSAVKACPHGQLWITRTTPSHSSSQRNPFPAMMKVNHLLQVINPHTHTHFFNQYFTHLIPREGSRIICYT